MIGELRKHAVLLQNEFPLMITSSMKKELTEHDAKTHTTVLESPVPQRTRARNTQHCQRDLCQTKSH